MTRLVVVAALVLGAAACDFGPLEALPLDIEMSVSNANPAVRDSVTFLIDAQGGTLLGVEIAFGDGTQDQFSTSGARTARVHFRHAYTVAGPYTVTATVADGSQGSKDASLLVTVRP